MIMRIQFLQQQAYEKELALVCPTLPQNDGPLQRIQRRAQLELSCVVYDYDKNNSTGLDTPVASLSAAVADSLEHPKWFAGWSAHASQAFLNKEEWEAKTIGEGKLTTFADYEKLFVLYPVPNIVAGNKWQDDGIFGSERLAGMNPMVINLVSKNNATGIGWNKLQVKLSPTILNAKFNGKTVVDILHEGRLYVTDFECLEGKIPVGNYQLAPIALYAKPDDFPGLLPLAIQLTQNPNDPSVYLAPQAPTSTTDYTWLMAKTFLQCADVNQGQPWYHLGGVHFIQTAFAVSMHRQLALQHPLNRLLTHHYVGLIGTCEIAYFTLLPPGGFFDQIFAVQRTGGLKLINDTYAKWTFENWGFHEDLKTRGVEDPAKLPYYPYRDDGLVIWNRLDSYVKDYVALYYANDKAVVQDYELQAWAQEVSSVLGVNVDNVPRFSAQIKTRTQLREVLRRLIWTAGPHHAAVNYPLTEFGTFVPNTPGAMANPIQGEVNETTLVDLLPNKNTPDRDEVGMQVFAFNSLANFWYDKLLDYHLCEADGSEAIVRKNYDLLTTEDRAKILANNNRWSSQAGLLGYPYLLPENITNSTST
jgi:arachidonate 15-lipoxygenase